MASSWYDVFVGTNPQRGDGSSCEGVDLFALQTFVVPSGSRCASACASQPKVEPASSIRGRVPALGDALLGKYLMYPFAESCAHTSGSSIHTSETCAEQRGLPALIERENNCGIFRAKFLTTVLPSCAHSHTRQTEHAHMCLSDTETTKARPPGRSSSQPDLPPKAGRGNGLGRMRHETGGTVIPVGLETDSFTQ